MLVLLAALIAAPALADDDAVDLDREAHVALSAGPVFTADRGNMYLSARAVRENDAYFGVEGRYAPGGHWVGRGGAGLDLLGGSKADLKLGLFLGGTGNGPDANAESVFGTEVSFGLNAGSVFARYRLLAGLGSSDLAKLHSENELMLGFDLVESLRIYGQLLVIDPTADSSETAAGLGVSVRF